MKLLLVALVTICASELAVAVIDRSLAPAAAVAPAYQLDEVPRRLGNWTSRELELDPRIFVASGASDIASRMYETSLGESVSLFLGTWLEYPSSIPHSPELCYPTHGWDVVDRKELIIPLDSDRSFIGKLMVIDQHGMQHALLYWYFFGPEFATGDEDARRALQTSRQTRTARPPLIKVMLQTNVDTPAAAEKRLTDLAAHVGRELHRLVQ